MEKNRKTLVLFVIFGIIIMAVGTTLAYFRWQSAEEQKTVVNFTIGSDFSCAADGGGDITSGTINLVPTEVNDNTTGNYIKRAVKVMPTIDTAGKTIYMDLWLDIKSISANLSSSSNLMYVLNTSSTDKDTGVITSGNFKSKNIGDKIELLSSKEYSATVTETYYLWIWLDAKETSSSTMNQSFLLSLNGSCTDKPLPYSEDILNGGYPQLDDGMIPVVFDTSGSSTLVKTISSTDANWYNYSNKKWANVVLVNNNSRANYLNTTGVTVSESDILAYYVWIPRYKYKIWSVDNNDKEDKEQEIQIIFENKSDSKTLGTQIGEYRTHPAFTFSTTELNGIWVGKFETTGTSSTPTVKPDVISLRSQNASTQFDTAQKFETSTYGSTSNIDAHMMKNSEWGAVAYLSHSKYGANREIYINNSSSYYTGRSGGNVGGSTAINTVYTDQTSTEQNNSYGFYTWDGFLLNYYTNTKSNTRDLTKVGSTTGNMTGVYDMSGGTYERVMGWYSGASDTFGATSLNYKSSFTSAPDSKYWDEYTTKNALTACNGGICYGHGLSEVNKWYGDVADFVSAAFPWFGRGGYYDNGAVAGAFYFNGMDGNAGGNVGFRSVLSFVVA